MFKAEQYDPTGLGRPVPKAGARFVVPVAEHHDGFPMYDCALTDWTAAKMGPRRDLVGDLAKAVRQQGLVFGVSSHRAEHWWFMNGGQAFDSDVRIRATPISTARRDAFDPKRAGMIATGHLARTPKYLEDWLARCCELVDKYQPQLFWFDWWIEQIVFQPYVQEFAAYYYNRGAGMGQGRGDQL